jgi:hypothetical protein
MAEFDVREVTFEDWFEILATAVVVAMGKAETPGSVTFLFPIRDCPFRIQGFSTSPAVEQDSGCYRLRSFDRHCNNVFPFAARHG